jgi:hypothetical protein
VFLRKVWLFGDLGVFHLLLPAVPSAAQPEPQRCAGLPGEAAREQYLHSQGPAQVCKVLTGGEGMVRVGLQHIDTLLDLSWSHGLALGSGPGGRPGQITVFDISAPGKPSGLSEGLPLPLWSTSHQGGGGTQLLGSQKASIRMCTEPWHLSCLPPQRQLPGHPSVLRGDHGTSRNAFC